MSLTEDEAKTLATAIAGVDGGCVYCAASVLKPVSELWPEFDWPALAAGSEEGPFYWDAERIKEVMEHPFI